MSPEQTIRVLIAGYFSDAAANEDAQAIRAAGTDVIGLAVVTKDLSGNVEVVEQDHAVRKGAITFGGAGVVIGLFAPPLLASAAIGAALGAGVGKVVGRKVTAGLKEQAGDSIPIGGAALMAAYPSASAAAVERAVKRAISRAIGEGTGSRGAALKAALADAEAKMSAAD